MSLQWFNSRYFTLGVFLSGLSYFICGAFVYLSSFNSYLLSSLAGPYFYVDYVGVAFSILSLIIFISLMACFNTLSSFPVFLFLSLIFSILCYFSCNSFLFWVFYELSILFLLALLFLESPYSERLLASWYLLGYVVFTSLPMFLCILYISLDQGSYNIYTWSCDSYNMSSGCIFCIILLSLLFITKIPLLPFHVWLPIVHAEAPSPVSVCLSGYIMKLGVLGLYRFSGFLLSDYIFNTFYTFLVLFTAIIFFFASCRELDGKRWLAFLSLAHITIVCFCVCYSDYLMVPLPYYFCLGHGLSAGSVFILLWLFYDVASSRNWVILKSSLFSGSFNMFFLLAGLFSAASIPPTITFFSEVVMLYSGVINSLVSGIIFFIYLFFSGLLPLFVFGHILGRSYSVSVCSLSLSPFYLSLFILTFWVYLLFIVF